MSLKDNTTAGVDRNLLEELQEQGLNYQEIGNVVGVTRQRVHQLLTGYHTGTSDKFRYLYTQLCSRCHKSLVKHLHHKDFDPSNNDATNIEPLCLSCHRVRHGAAGEKVIRISLFLFPHQIEYLESFAKIRNCSKAKAVRDMIEDYVRGKFLRKN